MTQRTWLLIGAAVVIVLAIFLFMGGEEPEPATEIAPEATETAPAEEPAAEGEAPAENN